jgi:hypothetical protein
MKEEPSWVQIPQMKIGAAGLRKTQVLEKEP